MNENRTPKQEKIQRSVLVVDDEQAYSAATGKILERNGYIVFKVASAAEALELLDSISPDLMLLDVMMPEKDGITLLRELAANPKWLGTPLVIVSAKVSPSDRSTAWMAGADAFLAKPFTSQELLDVIEYAMPNQVV